MLLSMNDLWPTLLMHNHSPCLALVLCVLFLFACFVCRLQPGVECMVGDGLAVVDLGLIVQGVQVCGCRSPKYSRLCAFSSYSSI